MHTKIILQQAALLIWSLSNYIIYVSTSINCCTTYKIAQLIKNIPLIKRSS